MQWYLILSVLVILSISHLHAADLDKANADIAEMMISPARPPMIQMEQVPRSPGSGFFWVRGYWQWKNNQWFWVGGQWERQPRPGAVWVDGRWRRSQQGWVWIPGEWR